MNSPRLPERTEWLIQGFGLVVNRLIRTHFSAVWMSGEFASGATSDRPVVVYMNHPSWWDPMIAWVVHEKLFGKRPGFAPIDARALEHYRFFARLGFFGVQRESQLGARQFLRTGGAILSDPKSVLWITPEGRFTDVRKRPVTLEPGLAHLLSKNPDTLAVPLAVEYVLGQEKLPEAFIRIGPAVQPALCSHAGEQGSAGSTIEAWNRALELGLESTQDQLAMAVMEGSRTEFHQLRGGKLGIAPGFDLWKRITSRLQGKAYKPGHREAVA